MSKSIPKIESTLFRYHPVLYISLICLSLAAVTFLFYQTYNTSTSTVGATDPVKTTFDKDTINKIETLNTPSEKNHTFSQPSGRINPFL